VFFKHKYITQPTVTPADSIVNAYHNLAKALQGIQNLKDNAHIEALKQLEYTLNPGYNQVIEISSATSKGGRAASQKSGTYL
jgi:hypothetical protein